MSSAGGGQDEDAAAFGSQKRRGSAGNEQTPSRTGSDASAPASIPSAGSAASLHVPSSSASAASLVHRTSSLASNVPSSRVGENIRCVFVCAQQGLKVESTVLRKRERESKAD